MASAIRACGDVAATLLCLTFCFSLCAPAVRVAPAPQPTVIVVPSATGARAESAAARIPLLPGLRAMER